MLIRRVEAEAAEMHSFGQKKANEQGLWLALDRASRHIIAVHVGERSRTSARQLGAPLPAVSREQATCYTDQDVVYTKVGFQRTVIKSSRKKPDVPIPLSGSTVRYASAFHA